jgi:hypothetical protein
MWVFLLPEYFIIVDFFPNLFNKSGKNPNGSEGLKNGFEETIFSARRTRPVFGEVTFTQFRTPAN